MEDKDINMLVDETLKSIDNIKRIHPGNADIDKILFNVTNKRFRSIELSIGFIYKAAAVFILMVSLNIFTWAHISSQKEKFAKEVYNSSLSSLAEYYFN